MSYLFIGEERSPKAIQMGVTWEDGRLAAKQLFDALRSAGIDPEACTFTNIFESPDLDQIRSHPGTVVAMGRRVERELKRLGVPHLFIYHPATRGTIRKKENYCKHVQEHLKQTI
jgi:hypothetical protein